MSSCKLGTACHGRGLATVECRPNMCRHADNRPQRRRQEPLCSRAGTGLALPGKSIRAVGAEGPCPKRVERLGFDCAFLCRRLPCRDPCHQHLLPCHPVVLVLSALRRHGCGGFQTFCPCHRLSPYHLLCFPLLRRRRGARGRRGPDVLSLLCLRLHLLRDRDRDHAVPFHLLLPSLCLRLGDFDRLPRCHRHLLLQLHCCHQRCPSEQLRKGAYWECW
mmetsp:Transcript_66839/g.139557  ORF Transcript_66839/g.139557 Transcript_66839/m.139557 type:complete len:219 (+) Transcript_66839:2930-3586(+)